MRNDEFTTNAVEDTLPVPGFNEPLTPGEMLRMIAVGDEEERKLKRELAKQNYLNIRQKRKKKR